MQQKYIFTLFHCLIMLCGWGISQNSQAQHAEIASWQTATPAGNGFLEKPLHQSIEKIGAMKGVYGVLVVRNGYLTYEKYFREGTPTKPHNLKSASKSVLSALVGIAIDKGYLRKEQFISDFFPFIKTLPDPRKRLITVQHLLNMTSGLESMSYQAYNSWVINEDWLTKLLKLPIVFEPGTKHQYSTGDSHILSAVLTAATRMSTKEFAEKYLFSPLHIKIKGWEVDPQGIYQGGNNLSLYPQDMARFGQLYLDNGKAAGQQIIPEAWVKESTSALQPNQHKVYGGYGYLWYSQPGGKNAFVAVGYGGQYIFVSPEHNAVVVIISTLYSKGKEWEAAMFKNIQHGILASIKDTSPATSPRSQGMKTASSLERTPTNGIATAKLNLRKGPGIKNSIITAIEPGSLFEIIDKKKSWLKVKTAQQKGWVASKFVHIIQPENFAITETVLKRFRQNTAVANRNDSLQKLQTSQEFLNNRLSKIEQDQEHLLENSSAPKDDFPSIKKQVTKLQKVDHQVVANYIQLQNLVDKLRLGLDQAESNYNALNDKIFSSQHQFAIQFDKSQIGIETIKNKLQKEIQELSAKLRERVDAIEKSGKKEQVEINAKIHDFSKKLQTSQETLQDQLQKIEQSQENQLALSATQKDELPSIKKQVTKLQDADREVLENYGQLQNNIDTLRLELDKAENKYSTLNEKFSASQNQYLDKLDKNQKDIEKISANLIEKVDAIDNSGKKEQTEINAKINDVSKKLQTSQETLQDRLKEIEQSQENQLALSAAQKDELPSIKKQVTKLQDADREVLENYGQLQNFLNNLKEEIDQAKDKISSLNSANLFERVDKIDKSGKKEQVELNAKINDVSKKLQTSQETLQDRLQKIEQSQENQLAFSAVQKDELPSIKKQVAKLQDADREVLANYSQLQNNIDTLRLGLDQAESNYNALNDKVFSSFQKYATKLDKNQIGIETKNNNRYKEIKDISANIIERVEAIDKSGKKEQVEINAKINDVSKKLQTSQETLQDRLKEIEQSQENQLALSAAQKDELPSIKKQVVKLQDADREVLANYGQLQNFLNNLKEEIDQAKDKISSLNSANLIERVEAIDKSAKTEQVEINAKINDVSKKLQTSQETLQDRLKEIEQSQENQLAFSAAQKDELPSIKKQVTELQDADREVLANYGQLQNNIDMLSRELDKAESKYSTLNEKFSASQNQYLDKLDKNKKDIEKFSAELTQRIDTIDSNNRNGEIGTNKKIAELSTYQTDLMKDFATTKLASQKNADQITELITTEKQLRSNQAETDTELKTLQSEFNARKLQINNIATNAKKETSQLRVDVSSLDKRISQQEAALGNTHKSIATYNETLRREIDLEKLSKDQLLTDLDAFKITIRSLVKQNEAIRKNLSSYQNKDEILQEKISSLETELAKQRQSHQATYSEISEYDSKLAKIEKDLVLLQAGTDLKEVPIALAQKKTTIRLPEPDKPPVSLEPAPKLVNNIELIAPFISSWSNAWSSQNVEEFLMHYSDNFTPPKGLSLKNWKLNRHKKIKKPKFIRITISDMKKQVLDSSNAKVVFRQSYKSNTYSDSVTKTILLRWQNDQWKIIRETSS